MADNPWVLWGGFHILIALLLILDLSLHRKAQAISVTNALAWSGVWIALSLLFNGLIYFLFGGEKALLFFTGYLIEKSLSVDNLFVFLLLFSFFNIPLKYQHKILFWGIIGALVLRISLILAGVALIQAFHWMTYVFGVFLCITALRFVLQKEKELNLEQHWLMRTVRRLVPVSSQLHDGHFFICKQGKWIATPLFIVLIMIEGTDVVFALDSIPAIFAITTDPFIVYTSNIFAILGLRTLYFALAGFIEKFCYFKYGLAAILLFTGLKMLTAQIFPISIAASLIVILLLLLATIAASIAVAQKKPKRK